MSERTHYAVLGVSPSARPGAIRRAWRRRTGKAGPGTPEFNRLNEAAEVLLDPERRRRYDASLVLAEPVQPSEPVTLAKPDPLAATPDAGAAPVPVRRLRSAAV